MIIVPSVVKNRNGGGASRSISRLTPVTGRSGTIVHSRPVLVAKRDLDSRCIRRLQKPSPASLTNRKCYDTFMRHSKNAPMIPSI